MKKITTFTLINRKSLLFFFYSVFFSFKSLAFLCGAPTVNGTGTITPSAAWQNVICTSGAVRYIEFTATVGNTYSFTTVTAVGGICTIDEQLSMQNTDGSTADGIYATSYVNSVTAVSREYFDWSPSSNGTYRIVISRYNTTDCQNLTANVTLSYIAFASTTNFSFWIGATNKDWGTISNWRRRISSGYPTNALPTASCDAIIPSGSSNQPTVGASTWAITRNLTVNSGAILKDSSIYANTVCLEIYGNFTNNGTYSRVGDNFTYLHGVGKTLGGIGVFNGGAIKILVGSSYTLSSNLTLDEIWLETSATTILNLSSYYLTVRNYFTQGGTINFNSGTLELNCDPGSTDPTLWNCGTGLFYLNVNLGSDVYWTQGFTFYDFKVNCPGFSFFPSYNLTILRNLTISASSYLDIETYTLYVGGDFTNNGTFSTSSGTVNLNGTNAQTIGGSNSSTFYNLVLNNTTGITLGKNTIVKNGGTLTLTAGYHNLTSCTLQVGTSSSTTITYNSGGLYSSTDNGSLKRYIPIGAVASSGGRNYGLFPFKKSVTEINFFELNSTSNVTTAGFITATPKFSNTILDVTDYSDGNGIVKKIKSGKVINVTISSIAGGAFNLKLSSGTFSSGVLTDYTLVTYSGSGIIASYTGSFVASTGNAALPVVKRSGVATADLANGWVVGTYNYGITPLPIEIISFTGDKIGENNVLKWSTLVEVNNDFFTIEKTNDGFTFEIVGILNGAGNSNESLDYILTDFNVSRVINYYRLRQTDFDGQSTLSDLISIDNNITENSKKIILKTNILGQVVNDEFKGLILIVYEDGTSIKTIQ